MFGLTACGDADLEEEIVVRPVRTIVVNEDATASNREFENFFRREPVGTGVSFKF